MPRRRLIVNTVEQLVVVVVAATVAVGVLHLVVVVVVAERSAGSRKLFDRLLKCLACKSIFAARFGFAHTLHFARISRLRLSFAFPAPASPASPASPPPSPQTV